MGDVAVEDGDLFGDGVNIAARLQETADANGVAISDGAHRELAGKLDLPFADAGEKNLKNIARPVRIWQWQPNAGDKTASVPRSSERPTLPDKPSIAVLPFQNMSDNKEQEYFADGMTEDIITGLSRFRSLFVIARNSTFSYKGKSPDVREVARDLGVRYILEGSVRQGGSRIRITGQLIDAETGNHLWAERYDRELEDIFSVQDEVTEAIVGAIAPEIGNEERNRAQRKPPDSLDAWGLYQRGLSAFYSSTNEGFRSAIELLDSVNDIDPTFALAFAMTAAARTRHVMAFMPDNRGELLKEAREKAFMAITLDPQDSTCLWSFGRAQSLLGNHDAAISKAEEAVAFNPNDAMARYMLGAVLCSAGRAREAFPHVEQAIRLSPHDIFLTGMVTHGGIMLFDLKRYEEALEWARRASLSPNPRSWTFALFFSAVLIKLERREEAGAALKDLLAFAPELSCKKFIGNPLLGGSEVQTRFADALREAGLPE